VKPVDLLIIGGGINGAGIARDAAGRGWSVMLCEKGDLGGATSSASSKLIHGGLRYLEYGEFRLVRESLKEREVLLRIAPHLIRPLRFVLPHDGSSRPRALIRLGLFLYDHLGGGSSLPGTATIDLRHHAFGRPLRPDLSVGFAYSDAMVDDARLVIANARDAARHGALIRTRTPFLGATRTRGLWRVRLREEEIEARVIVNAAGPWVGEVAALLGLDQGKAHVRLVKGSHIVVKRLYDGDHAYILENEDRRVVFLIPFGGDFTLIGTTEVPVAMPLEKPAITPQEIDYLCRAASHWLARPVGPDAVVWSYAGVRPLYDDHAREAAAVTRDYVLTLDTKGAPALSIFGGKITTFRRLAEHALAKLGPSQPAARGPWTATSPLPGGDLGPGGLRALIAALEREYPWLDAREAARLAHAYGSEARLVLGSARSATELTAAETAWMRAAEWAVTDEDILWRRSKLGLLKG